MALLAMASHARPEPAQAPRSSPLDTGKFSKGSTIYYGLVTLLVLLTFLAMVICEFKGLHAAGSISSVGPVRELAYRRYTGLSNFVSPLVPASLAYCVMHVFCASNLVRLNTATRLASARRNVVHADGRRDPSARADALTIALLLEDGPKTRGLAAETTGLAAVERDVVATLECSWEAGPAFISAIGLLLVACVLLVFTLWRVEPLSTFEGPSGNWLFAISIGGCLLSLSTSFAWLLIFHRRLLSLLRVLARTPLAAAFSRLPPGMASSVPILLASHKSWLQDLSVSFQQLRTLVGRLQNAPHALLDEEKIDSIEKLAAGAEAQFAADLAAHGPRGDLLTSPTFAALVRIGRVLVDWLSPSWGPVPTAPSKPPARAS
jgi:hypothetical protein